MENCSATSPRRTNSRKKRPVVFSSSSFRHSPIWGDLELLTETSNLKIYFWTNNLTWKWSISAFQTPIKWVKNWQPLVDLPVMRLPSWSKVWSTMGRRRTCGRQESCFSRWFAGTCPLKIQTRKVCIRRFWMHATNLAATYPPKWPVSFKMCLCQILNYATVCGKSPPTRGSRIRIWRVTARL